MMPCTNSLALSHNCMFSLKGHIWYKIHLAMICFAQVVFYIFVWLVKIVSLPIFVISAKQRQLPDVYIVKYSIMWFSIFQQQYISQNLAIILKCQLCEEINVFAYVVVFDLCVSISTCRLYWQMYPFIL
jgi:hypothetical protein